MPLKKGKGSFKYNYNELAKKPIQSPARRKAIVTIAKKNGISKAQARAKQAVAIAKSNLFK